MPVWSVGETQARQWQVHGEYLLQDLPTEFLGIDGGWHCPKDAITQRPKLQAAILLRLAPCTTGALSHWLLSEGI